MNLFYKDTANNLQVTWEELTSAVCGSDYYNPYSYSDDYYEVFKHIVTSLIVGEEIVLLDSDFSVKELIDLTGCSEFSKFKKPLQRKGFPIIKDKNNLLEILKKPTNNWSITLFTSGTTDLPKKVSHTFKSITRFVKISERNSSDIWGFSYNPTHIAGVQVFFQALLNGNSIIRLFSLSKEEIYKEIKENSITHISATPTFYRLLLPCSDSYPSILRITSGGEKFDKKTINQLMHIFPNAKITNIYASTEAGTIFASNCDIFTVKPEMENLIRVDSNELFIHKSLLGTLEIIDKEWYNTGDLVEIITENPLKFRFISRKNEMINVGGYKVNPSEVEETILNMSGIKNVRVYAKSNSVLGNIICCEIVRSDNRLEEAFIRTYLKSILQEFKIPRMIRFVDKLSITRTGKIKRN